MQEKYDIKTVHHNYDAMHACLDTNNPEAALLLIDRGMDFDAFLDWAKERVQVNPGETLDAVMEYWQTHKREQEWAREPKGPELGPTMAGV